MYCKINRKPSSNKITPAALSRINTSQSCVNRDYSQQRKMISLIRTYRGNNESNDREEKESGIFGDN